MSKHIDYVDPDLQEARRNKSKVGPNCPVEQVKKRQWLWLYKAVCLKAFEDGGEDVQKHREMVESLYRKMGKLERKPNNCKPLSIQDLLKET
ncbi:hypothetical protein PTT_19538 [Pyrenophora teres f. teres 0-1]|uniref:Uncharacterized protein n=1 Tax=Pyrenophora teres f. teres (strain 0-1) TaxID=861557 RepID=E3S945_PYRTT|nr:hypothetical protein PTT_19538 [Pyrenophora teres f. teres 0-1]